MKRVLMFTLLFTLILMLSGCGACEHEWSEADCLNASVCTKCDEPGEPALGHSWAAATCAAPETCTRCGETQGAALEHTFGDWFFESAQMYRTCSGCGTEERTDADPETYLQQVLPGHWDFSAYNFEGEHFTTKDLRYGSIGFYAAMEADGTCRIFDGSRLYENGTWKFTEHKETGEYGSTYYLEMTLPNATPMVMILGDKDGQQQLYFFFDETNRVTMHQNRPLASALTGSWSGTANGTLYTLELNADRTVTGSLGEPVTGTWHLEPMEENSGYRSCTLNIQYLKDGWPNALISTLNLGSTDQPLEDSLEGLTFSMWQPQLGSVRFEKNDPETLRQLEAALAQGQQKLIGTWQSEMLRYTLLSDNSETEQETTAYSMTFAEDGTFTALFDKEYTGTWVFDKVEPRNDDVTYRYSVRFDGSDRDLNISTIGRGRIYFGGSSDTHSLFSWFNQISDGVEDHDALAPELILGTWTTVAMEQYISESQPRESVDPIPYTLTVNADGTFTAEFGETLTGTWVYREYDYGYYGYKYAFSVDGSNGSMVYSIADPGTLNAFYDIGGTSTTMTMTKNP